MCLALTYMAFHPVELLLYCSWRWWPRLISALTSRSDPWADFSANQMVHSFLNQAWHSPLSRALTKHMPDLTQEDMVCQCWYTLKARDRVYKQPGDHCFSCWKHSRQFTTAWSSSRFKLLLAHTKNLPHPWTWFLHILPMKLVFI